MKKAIQILSDAWHKFDFEINDLLKDRYYFDKKIAWAFLIMTIMLVAYTIIIAPEGGMYYECLEGGWHCFNPAYKQCDQEVIPCEIEYFPPGTTYGEKPPWIVTNIKPVLSYIAVTLLIINHFLYNKGKIKQLFKEAKTWEV